jgi:hypothetical protein
MNCHRFVTYLHELPPVRDRCMGQCQDC